MRIAVLTEEFGAYTTIFLQRQIDALAEFRPVVGCWKRSNPEAFPYEPVHVLRSRSPFRRAYAALAERLRPRVRPSDPAGANAALRGLIARERPDLLYIHFGWMGARVLETLERGDLPYVLVLHGTDLAVASHFPRSRHARRMRRAMEAAARCLFVSRFLLETGVRFGAPAERSEVFYLGIPVPERAAAPAAPGPLRVVANGRFVPVKGHDLLLRAFASIVRGGVDARLVLVGEGPLEAQLRSMCSESGLADRVEFLGTMQNEHVYRLLARQHLFVHAARVTSRGEHEGLGLAVQEAMAAGLPVVATRSGGVPESVVDGETGRLVPVDDEAALTAAIAALAADPASRESMGRAGRARAQQLFDVARQNRILVERLRALAVRS